MIANGTVVIVTYLGRDEKAAVIKKVSQELQTVFNNYNETQNKVYYEVMLLRNKNTCFRYNLRPVKYRLK